MAKIVLGIATSHTPMLNTPAKDWPSFIDRDGVRDFLDKEGDPATYEELLSRPDPRALPELTPERFAARHDEAQAAIEAVEARHPPRRTRRADHRRRRPEGAVPRGSPAVHSGLLRRHDPQRAAVAQFQGPGMVAAGHRALLRGEGAARLPGRRTPGVAPDRRADRPRIRHRLVERVAARDTAKATPTPLCASG